MQIHDGLTIADHAVSGNAERPASAILHDSPDARLIVFRIDAAQEVPMHSSTSTVILLVLRGSGIISGPVDGVIQDRKVTTGNVVSYQPGESHGMRAVGATFVVLATIAPSPGVARAVPLS
jgi:quercetin dioxygenase-like cupin family protein